MSATMPAKLPLDAADRNQLRRGERKIESAPKRTKRRLTSRTATIASLVIAVLWTVPTFGLFLSSLRPGVLVQTTGWWTIFQNWGFTFDNYTDVLRAGNGQLNLAGSFINSLAITIPATAFPLVIASLAAYAFAWIDFKGKTGCSSRCSRCRSCRSRWRSCHCSVSFRAGCGSATYRSSSGSSCR